jgi:hypothetical protein
VCLVRQPLGALPTPCITRDLVTCFPDWGQWLRMQSYWEELSWKPNPDQAHDD